MEVNFIFQVRSFHRLKREVQISANAQALWLELFGLFNERRFPESMPVSTTHLSAMLGISSDTVIRARKELIEADLLETVGERKGRQHTVYKIKYFTMSPAREKPEYVDNSADSVDNSVYSDICDASQDTICDANVMPHMSMQHAAQTASQPAAQRAAYDGFYAAQDDANCGAYINNRQRTYKLKLNRNHKHPSRIQKKPAYHSATSTLEEERNPCGDTSAQAKERGSLHFNDAWMTDARARRRTAQNVIDACPHPAIRAEDGLNELLCRYMEYGMSPEQELDAIAYGGQSEGVKALQLLDDAADRLGIYHSAFERGKLDVKPMYVHAFSGDLAMARMQQGREEFNAFFAEVNDRIRREYGASVLRELTPEKRRELREYASDVLKSRFTYPNFESQYTAIKQKLGLREG